MTSRMINDLIAVLSEYKFCIDAVDATEVSCVICKGILKNAAQSTCGCNFCWECIKGYLGDESKNCPSGRICCSDEILSMDENIQIDHRVNRNIANMTVKCPNEGCSFKDHLGNIASHMRICEQNCAECPYANLGCSERNIAKDKIFAHLQNNMYRHSGIVVGSIENINNELSLIRNMNDGINAATTSEKALIEEVERLKIEIDAMKLSNETLSENIRLLMAKAETENSYQSLLEKVNKIEDRMNQLNNVTKTDDFFWKIDDFSAKQKVLPPMFRKEITSSPFYSHNGGYKLRLKVYPNGYGAGANTHLFVSFCIMKGEFDDSLEWPCKHTITLSFVNQGSGQDHKSFSFCYDTISTEFKDSFMRPKNQMNKVLGDDEFISFEEMYSNCDLVKNDSIVIKCSVKIL